MMKRVIAIFLIFSFLSTNTEFGEVWKLPILIHHFVDHSKIENHLSFVDFINEHYKDLKHHHGEGNHHHENLPFKTINIHSSVVFSIPVYPDFDFEREFNFDTTKEITLYKPNFCSSDYLDSIWEPPRFC